MMMIRKMRVVTRWAVMGVLAASILAPVPARASGTAADREISEWVRLALRHDQRVDADAVTVSTAQGIVTLGGALPSLAARSYADRETKKIRGVHGVLNEITIEPTFRSDADIVNHLRRRILNDAIIESEGIRVGSLNGKVTLRGEVATWSEADQAVLLASEVRGVKEVENRLRPKYTSTRSDQEIKNDAVASLRRDVYLADLPITVVVKDGILTLTGSVGSPFEKDRATRSIRWVSNVKSVKNDLAVEPVDTPGVRKQAPHATDAALRAAVRDELGQDSRVDASKIEVTVSFGGVTLAGAVPDHLQKRLAEQDVRDVIGVGWVTSKLFAKTDAREDWAVQDDIEFNFATDFSLEGFDLEAGVQKGVVTLAGTVHHAYQKTHAADVAGRVRGVRNVVTNIKVERETATSRVHPATAIADEIRSGFQWHWTTHWIAAQIDVRVKDGVATLTGDVDTWAQRREAGQIAFTTEGVWKVVNKLAVAGYDYDWEKWDYEYPYGDYEDYYYGVLPSW